MRVIATIFLVLIIPIITICGDWIADLMTVRVASGLHYFAVSLGVSLWFLWLGLKIAEKCKDRFVHTSNVALIGVSVVAFMGYVAIDLVGRFDLFMRLSDYLGSYLSEMVVYRFPMLLYGVVFMVLGVLLHGKDIGLSGRKGWVYGGISLALYLTCCVGAELVYYGLDDLHVGYALIHAVSAFPLLAIGLVIYGLTYSKEYSGKVADFLAYLCPSAIFIYVLKLYSSPILVLLYLVGMWFVYRKFARK